MTGRSTGPGEEPGAPRDLDPVARELERYAGLTAGEMPHGLSDRVMSAVAEERTPRRGVLAALLAPFTLGGASGTTRALMVAGTMALAVLAVVVAGRLGDVFRNTQIGTSPSPSVLESRVEVPTASPSTTLTPTPTPTPSLKPRPSPSGTPRATPTQSAEESPRATASDDDHESSDGEDGTETPEPSSDDSSGSDSGEDDSG